MKNNALLTIAVCVAMVCTPKVVTQTILIDRKDGSKNTVDKTTELIIPRPIYNVLDIDSRRRKKDKIRKLQPKEGNVKLYNAQICRGNTYRSNTNIRRVQR